MGAREAGHDEYCEVSTEGRFVASATTAAPFTTPPTPLPTRSPTPPPTPSPTRLPTPRPPTSPPTSPPTHSPTSPPATRSPTPPTPLSPGCYYKQAMASSKCPGSGPFLDWERDVWGEANADSGASLENCLARKTGHDGYCEVSTEWRFVPSSPAPAAPGDSSSPSFKPQPCNWGDDLHS